MTGFIEWVQGFFRTFKPWITVKPWEQGVRVRAGKRVRLLHAGMHPKFPFIDSVTVLPVRRRMLTFPTQTVTTRDGKSVTVGMAVEFEIEDVERVFRTVHHPEATIVCRAQAIVLRAARKIDAAEITGRFLEDAVDQEMDVVSMGFGSFETFITDLVVVRTYRILKDERWVSQEETEKLGREA